MNTVEIIKRGERSLDVIHWSCIGIGAVVLGIGVYVLIKERMG